MAYNLADLAIIYTTDVKIISIIVWFFYTVLFLLNSIEIWRKVATFKS